MPMLFERRVRDVTNTDVGNAAERRPRKLLAHIFLAYVRRNEKEAGAFRSTRLRRRHFASG